MNQIDEMRDLIEKLNYYTKLYDEGNPSISDKEWDDMFFHLQKLEEETGISLGNSPTIHVDYQVVNQLNKVKHNHPMLSLDKTKSEDEVVAFLADHDGIAMAKMDGLTCSLCYEDGLLTGAETRGNGEVGEDILQNIVRIKGVPVEIPIHNKFVVDGEVICTYQDFEEFSDIYKNPRNFASGSIRLLDSRVSAQRKLTFIAWDCITGLEECKTLSNKIVELDSLGFITVPYFVLPNNDLSSITYSINSIKDTAQKLNYPIDGIVFKYDNCEYYQSLGATGHHFRGGLAYKFYDEEYETRLRDIEWSMGKTGILTPVAKFDAIETDESVIERASLHNLNIIRQVLGRPYMGQRIKVIKANQIIPQVIWGEKATELEDDYTPPSLCPYCGAPTKVVDDFVYCSNAQCEGKLINKLDHFCGKKGLDIKRLSKNTLEKLITWGWVSSIEDIFNLTNRQSDWKLQPGFGEKSVNNILTAIEGGRHCELYQFISALGIPLIGSTYAKQIAKTVQDWHSFRELVQTRFNFAEWPDFGPEMNDALHRFNYAEADILSTQYLVINNSLWNQKEEKSNITGKTFVITGKLNNFKNRGLLQAEIEKHGGHVSGAVSSNTSYLVNNDINSSSSKNVKAKQLGIPIITEEELLAMF